MKERKIIKLSMQEVVRGYLDAVAEVCDYLSLSGWGVREIIETPIQLRKWGLEPGHLRTIDSDKFHADMVEVAHNSDVFDHVYLRVAKDTEDLLVYCTSCSLEGYCIVVQAPSPGDQ